MIGKGGAGAVWRGSIKDGLMWKKVVAARAYDNIRTVEQQESFLKVAWENRKNGGRRLS